LKPLVIIGNKADKLDEIEIINLRNEIPEIVLISAKENWELRI
jgi:tRNA modification GTPase